MRLIRLFVYVLFLGEVSPVYAEAQAPKPITIMPVVGFTSLNQAISTLLGVTFLLGGLLCFGYILFGALKYITAQDDSGKTAEARKTIQNAVIGLVILGCVYILFKFVSALIPGLGDFFQ